MGSGKIMTLRGMSSMVPGKGDIHFGVFPWVERLKDLARIEDAVRVDEVLDALHPCNLDRWNLIVEVGALGQPDSMFAADSASLSNYLVHQGVECLAGPFYLLGLVLVIHDVDVQIAISSVSEYRDRQAGVGP